MERILRLFARLRDAAHALEHARIDLPQIVMIGSQSAGKSSVIEAIVGKEVFVRGDGIVTRTPIEVTLVHSAEGPDRVVFEHLPSETFTDFALVRDQIMRRTWDIAGGKKGVVRTPIRLTLTSPDVVDLTLIDLPGMTKVPVGDQPPDIELQILSLVFSYCENPNAIIVAVSPANSDLANSDALTVAREVDPEGLRTLGVLTKLDLMDRGTNATDILLNRQYPLRHGFVGVVGRSQKDTNLRRDLRWAEATERAFFEETRDYHGLRNVGITALRGRMQELLVAKILEAVPGLLSDVSERMAAARKILSACAPRFEGDNGTMLLSTVSNLSDSLAAAINGTDYRSLRGLGNTPDALTRVQLRGGPRLRQLFMAEFPERMRKAVSRDDMPIEQMRQLLLQMAGTSPPLLIAERALDLALRSLLAKFRAPSLALLQDVASELRSLFPHLLSQIDICTAYPALSDALFEVVRGAIETNTEKAVELANARVDIELALINVRHPSLLAGRDALLLLCSRLYRARHPRAETQAAPAGPRLDASERHANLEAMIQMQASEQLAEINAKRSAAAAPPRARQLPDSDWVMVDVAARDARSGSVSASAQGPAAPAQTPPPPPPPLPQRPAPALATVELTQEDLDRITENLLMDVLWSYVDVVLVNLCDALPKIAVHGIVRATREQLHALLIERFFRPDELARLFVRSASIEEQARAARLELTELERVHGVLLDMTQNSL